MIVNELFRNLLLQADKFEVTEKNHCQVLGENCYSLPAQHFY